MECLTSLPTSNLKSPKNIKLDSFNSCWTMFQVAGHFFEFGTDWGEGKCDVVQEPEAVVRALPCHVCKQVMMDSQINRYHEWFYARKVKSGSIMYGDVWGVYNHSWISGLCDRQRPADGGSEQRRSSKQHRHNPGEARQEPQQYVLWL